MPIISALVWCLVGPLVGAVLVYGIFAVVLSRESDLAFLIAFLVVCVPCLFAAGRSLAARVVAGADGVAVHNAFGTVRAAWADIEDINVIIAFNTEALVNALWYGVGLRVRGRRRQVRILASWYRREERAQEFADRLRSLTTAAGAG